ncbi:MAG: outer membrane lipoprotein-sorting protein [Planctomycetota bacterium]|jgi:outer membrane lipoprotein-sorting protein
MRFSQVIFPVGLMLLAAAFVAPNSTVDDSVDEVVEEPVFLKGKLRDRAFFQIEKRMGALSSVVATFEQEKHLALFKEPLLSEGQLLFSVPDHLRWESNKPFRSVLIVSGDQVAKFEKKGPLWRKLKQDRQAELVLIVMDNIRSWFRGEFNQTKGGFWVEIAREPRPMIVMRPKDKLMARTLDKIELLLSENLTHVERVTISEASGDKTVMKFTQIERAPSLDLDQKLFSLSNVIEIYARELESKPVAVDKGK